MTEDRHICRCNGKCLPAAGQGHAGCRSCSTGMGETAIFMARLFSTGIPGHDCKNEKYNLVIAMHNMYHFETTVHV